MTVEVMAMNKTYSELIQLKTYKERFEYLKLNGVVGEETFGSKRWMNQILYKNPRWRRKRRDIIIRDNGCDLGIVGREIKGSPIIVHHINPITIDDVLNDNPMVYDDENLICTVKLTHDAIHYSDDSLLIKDPIERKPNDTCPWKR